MTHRLFCASIASVALFLIGCSGAAQPPDSGDGGLTETSDLPCEIENLLATYCRRCHQEPLLHVPMTLSSHADITHISYEDPTTTYAERSVVRMRASTLPMPPSGARPTEAEIAAFEAWVNAGAPEGQCEP